MFMNNRAFTHPVLILLIAALLIGVMSYWLYSNTLNFSSSSNVKGISVRNVSAQPGFAVTINASNSGWDLVEYICRTLDECLLSLTSGKRVGLASGGISPNHEVVVNYSKSWEGYSHIKYFVRPARSDSNKPFKVTDVGRYPDSDLYTLSDNGETYDVMIAPLNNLSASFYKSATFSDAK